MSLTQIVVNTWKCDSCQIEAETESNPFFRLVTKAPLLERLENCEVDYCRDCMAQITAQLVIDYADSVLILP